MALTTIRYSAQNSVAIGGVSDITGLEASGGSIQNDPKETLDSLGPWPAGCPTPPLTIPCQFDILLCELGTSGIGCK
jgi:hypothetical protein